MPCYDPRDRWDRELAWIGQGLLCELIRAGKVDPADSPQLARWWHDHEHEDEYHERRGKER
jgi:hypothetical protein